ncbi:MAG: AAA family ATPase [Kiritimatiellaeota bacterium]|nr:AAA family ATPase [Kiritimatiellota bacterium]
MAPCDKCDSCKEITSGSSLDVIEIDGASNNSVDQVRDLREGVAFAPARGPFKIYIIDEVHMLSISAFNALLKTLEEPPKHVKFFFATTDPQKVPTTILSRCQRFDLRRITLREIVGQLEKIAKAEKIEIAPDALLAIARGAEGGLRSARRVPRQKDRRARCARGVWPRGAPDAGSARAGRGGRRREHHAAHRR